MHHGDARLIDRVVEPGKVEYRVGRRKAGQADHRADDVEVEVHQGRPAGVPVGADGGEHGGDGGADVLAHNNRDGVSEGNRSGDGQRLQYAHRGGGGLNNRCQQGAGQHTQNGVGEQEQDIGELRHLLQTGHRCGHGLHTGHEDSEAQQNHAHIPALAVFQEDVEDDADHRQDGREGGGLEQPDEEVIALDARQAQNPGGHRGAHVGAHDNADGLAQGHNAGVDKAHHHNRGGRRGLNDRRHNQAHKKALGRVGGQPFQYGLQLAAGTLLQALAHDRHAVQEHGQAAHQGQYVE